MKFGRLLLRNIRLLRSFDQSTANLYLGLLSFALANVPFFMAASGVYGDPFVLILVGLSLGSFLAPPTLVYSQAALLPDQEAFAGMVDPAGSIATTP